MSNTQNFFLVFSPLVYTLEQILQSPIVYEPLHKLACCPTSDGAGAAVLCSEEFVYKYGLQNRAIEIAGMSMATDLPSSFNEQSCIKMVGFDMTQKAAKEVYAQSGLGPNDVQVVELHDCFASNELVTYEALGLCPIGGAGKYIDAGDNTYGGKHVVNPSGGLISKVRHGTQLEEGKKIETEMLAQMRWASSKELSTLLFLHLLIPFLASRATLSVLPVLLNVLSWFGNCVVKPRSAK